MSEVSVVTPEQQGPRLARLPDWLREPTGASELLLSAGLATLTERLREKTLPGRPAAADATGQYFNEVGRIPLLSGADEERILAQCIEAAASLPDQDNSQAALEGKIAQRILIQTNLRLVISVAKRYPLIQGIELLDLITYGNMGLEHATRKFDWRKGFKFSTYATFWIRQSIGRALDSKVSLIPIPYGSASSIRANLRAADGDVETLSECQQYLHRVNNPVSIHAPDEDTRGYEDMLPGNEPAPEASIERIAIAEAVRRVMHETLSAEQRQVLELRFDFENGGQIRSYTEVGAALGVSATTASKEVRGCFELMRESLAKEELHLP